VTALAGFPETLSGHGLGSGTSRSWRCCQQSESKRKAVQWDAEVRRLLTLKDPAWTNTTVITFDQWNLMVFPVILGSGKRLFPTDAEDKQKLELVDTTTYANGVQLQIFRPA